MKLGNLSRAAALLLPAIVYACGGSSETALFGTVGPSATGSGGGIATYTGGIGGQLPQGGGSAVSGAANGGSLFGTGGVAGASAGGAGGFTGGAGGLAPENGGAPSNGGAVGDRDGGSTPLDGGFNPLTCDFSGTWASYVSIDVTWPGTIVLLQGQGKLQQWNLTREVQAPLSTTVTAHTKPCGIFLPDLQTTIFNFFQKYGIRFPDALFDHGTIPETTFNFVADITKTPITFKTDPFAIVIGSALANPTTAAWPAASAMTLRDDDNDKNPGITVIPVTTNGYSLPPANLLTGELADLVYITTRTVSALSGTISDCNKIEADVTIQTVNGKPGIDSTVVGCRKQASKPGQTGTPCSADEASFVDGARPQFTPTGPGHMTIVRVAESATCADVRARFPLQ